MENIKTTTKNAYNPETGEEYQIDFPAPDEIKQAILNLDQLSEGITVKKTVEELAEYFNLSDEQKAAKHKSKIPIFYHIVYPALQALKKKGKVEQPDGERKPYLLVREEKLEKEYKQDKVVSTVEDIEKAYQNIHKELAETLLQHIRKNSPKFFEKLVVDLLVKMGYGGSREDAGKAVGQSGDGGIDGIINEDRLGLDVVYIQAKRQEANVGEPPIRDFIGALDGKGAQKGIFITLSDFSSNAKELADRSSKKIVLIDGTQLAEYMIIHNVGVSIVNTYDIKRVDSDYFAEE